MTRLGSHADIKLLYSKLNLFSTVGVPGREVFKSSSSLLFVSELVLFNLRRRFQRGDDGVFKTVGNILEEEEE